MSKSDQALLADISTMMSDAQEAANDEKIDEIMSKIRNLNPNKTSDQLRLASCHFMTMYHTRKAMTIGTPSPDGSGMGGGGQLMSATGMMDGGDGSNQIDMEAVESFKAAQRTDMELGWRLLDIKGSNSHAARTARVLKIEVAQRLEDSFKLEEAFKELMGRQLSEEETMVAFTAAPFLGDWKAMLKLGTKIEKMPGGLEQLHMMSLQLPIPDFTLIYELVKEHSLNKKKKQSPEELRWDLFNVEKIRVKFKNVDCGDFPEKRQELLDEIQKQGEMEWEDVPNCSHVHVKRMGALCQAVSFGEVPMMLNGPWFDDLIHVKGRTEMPLMPEEEQIKMQQQMQYGQMPSPDSMTILVQEEEWNLQQDPSTPTIYRGSYTLKQRPELPPGKTKTSEHAPVNMSFECEVHLKTHKSLTSENKTRASNEDHKDSKEDENDEGTHADEEEQNRSSANEKNDKVENIESTDDKVKDESLVTEFDGLELD